MGILYRNSQGVETPVAGLAPAGQLVPSVSLYQSGTTSGASAQATTLEPGGFTILTISLPTSMPDSNYVVQAGTDSAYVLAEESPHVRETTSFRLYLTNQSLTETVDITSVTIKWQAFKLLTNEDRALDEERIATNTRNFANEFSATSSYAVGDYCTYQGVLYRCTVAHVQSAWNSSHFTQVTVGGQLKVHDISSSITIGDGYSSGTISVYRDGNTVQVLFNSVQTTAYDRIICSGLPRPLHNTYFCVQADGNPQGLGLGALSEGGSITSGNSSAGMGPSKIWDGFITYLTRD